VDNPLRRRPQWRDRRPQPQPETEPRRTYRRSSGLYTEEEYNRYLAEVLRMSPEERRARANSRQRRDEEVRDVHHLADPKVDGAAAEGVSLLPVESARPEVVDHVEEGVSRRERRVLALVSSVPGHGDACGSEEAAGRRELGRGEVVVTEELEVADAASLRLALS
jgi:hypothetical protein